MSEQNKALPQELAQSNSDIMSLINAQKELTKMMVLYELLKIEDRDITIAGDKEKVSNLELITEYPSPKYVQFMVKNETWRKSIQEVMHLPSINDEKLVGTMDMQVILKMNSYKRKRPHEIVNALRNEIAGTEVIPSMTRRKKFFGLV